jgi:hypothetical protein
METSRPIQIGNDIEAYFYGQIVTIQFAVSAFRYKSPGLSPVPECRSIQSVLWRCGRVGPESGTLPFIYSRITRLTLLLVIPETCPDFEPLRILDLGAGSNEVHLSTLDFVNIGSEPVHGLCDLARSGVNAGDNSNGRTIESLDSGWFSSSAVDMVERKLFGRDLHDMHIGISMLITNS